MTDPLEQLVRETASKCTFGSIHSRSEHILAALRQAVEQFHKDWKFEQQIAHKALLELSEANKAIVIRDELLRDMAYVIDGDYDPKEVLARYEALKKQ